MVQVKSYVKLQHDSQFCFKIEDKDHVEKKKEARGEGEGKRRRQHTSFYIYTHLYR
jgi:hypothetical protein